MVDANLIYSLGSGVVGILAGYFVPKIKISKKIEDDVNTGFKAADTAIGVAKMASPNNKYVNLLDIIEKKAEKAVDFSEQAYHKGDISTDEGRFKSANDYVLNALNIIGVTPTQKVRQYIEETIQAYVNKLGHATPSEAEKNAQIAKAQQDLVKVQSENEQLRQKIATVQNTVATTQAAIQVQNAQTQVATQ